MIIFCIKYNYNEYNVRRVFDIIKNSLRKKNKIKYYYNYKILVQSIFLLAWLVNCAILSASPFFSTAKIFATFFLILITF